MPLLTEPPAELVSEIAREAAGNTSPLLEVLVQRLRERFGESLAAVLLYGSSMHEGDPSEGLVDLYALVDEYRSAYPTRLARWLNRWIPPNVFYLEAEEGGVELRSKYAVLSLAHFEQGCSDWFHSYLWARFAQPVRTLYARDRRVEARVHSALATAVLRFLREGASASDLAEGTATELWTEALQRSYAAELRAETGERARYLAARHELAYERLTRAAAPALTDVLEEGAGGRYSSSGDPEARGRSRRRWEWRRRQGRLLSLLRLAKAALTFEGGIDYLAWKIERHTGESLEVTPRMRRYPLIFAWPPLWRLLRRGVVR